MGRARIRDRLDIALAIEYASKDLGLVEGTHFDVMFRGNVTYGGSCGWPENGKCEIFINHRCDYWLESIFHELQHCKDMLDGLFISVAPKRAIWDGVEMDYLYGPYNDRYEIYINQPWEIKANDYADKLLRRRDFQKLYQIVLDIMKKA